MKRIKQERSHSHRRTGLAMALVLSLGLLAARGLAEAFNPVLLSLEPSTAQTGNDADSLANMSLEDLMNVEVTSVSKSKQRIADAPAAVTVITQEDIQRSGLHEIPEILRLAPGLFVQRGNQFTGWSVSSRGFGDLFANKLLVLQDGRTVYMPFFSGVYWNTVDYPTADLDRIEVIRGPGATLWGANAVNGVINITTQSAKDTQGVLVDSRVGTDSSDLAVRYGGKIDPETYYRVYAKGRAYDDLEYAPNPAGEANQWQDSRGGFRIDRFVGDTDTLTLQGDVYYQNVTNNLLAGNPVPNYKFDYSSGRNLLARWTHVVSDRSDYTVQGYYDRINHRESWVDYQLDTFDVDFQHRFELSPRQEIIYGLGARLLLDEVGAETRIQPPVDPTSRATYVLSAFVQDTIALLPDRLHLTLGSKFELNSFTGLEVQPSARLMWTPNESNSIWLAASRAMRTPSRFEENDAFTLMIPIGGGQFAELQEASDHPESEELLAYEIGYRRQIGRSFSADITGFANIYNDLISRQELAATFEPASTPPLKFHNVFTNGRSAETYGVEVAAKWQIAENWRLAGSYSLLTAFVHDDKSSLAPTESGIERSAPRNQLQLHSYWDVTPKLAINTSLYYVEGIGNDNVVGRSGSAPSSYVRVDLGMSWHPRPGLKVSAGIQNAFDVRHLETSFNADSSAEVERAIYGQLTWQY